MEEDVGGAVVVHAAVDEMDAWGVLKTWWEDFAGLELGGVEEEVVLVACVEWVVVLEFLCSLLSPERGDF